MKSIGFDDASIANATIIFTAVMLILNIPLGIIADRWSRKGVLICSSIFLTLSCLICAISTGPVIYTVGLALWAVYLSCYLGAFDSIIYDVVLEETGKSEDFEKLYGRAELYNTVAYVSAALISGVIAHWISLRAVYIVSVPFALASILPLIYFNEPILHKKSSAEFVKTHIKEIFEVFATKNQVLLLVASTVLIASSLRILLEFGPLWFVALSLPIILYGPATALSHLAIGLCGMVATYIKNKRFRIVLIASGISFGGLVLTTSSLPAIILAISLMLLGYMALAIILNRYLHDVVPSNIRVGVSSVVATIGYVIFLPMAYLFGQISNKYTVFNASWILIISSVASIFLISKVVAPNRRGC